MKIWCLSLCFSVCHSEAGALFVRGDIVWATIVSLFMGRFWFDFQRFSEVMALSDELDSLHSVARWRHNFREIGVKNCEKSKNRRKSFCAPLRIDIWDIKKIPPQDFRARNVDMHVHKIFPALRYYSAGSIIVKFRIGSPKMARNEQFMRTKSHIGSKFSQIYFGHLCTGESVVVQL